MFSVDQSFSAKDFNDPTDPTILQRSARRRGEELFLAHLERIEGITAATSARLRLSPQDAEDFASTVKVRLIEDDYGVLRRFRGHCRWSTFLTSVIRNMGRDFLIQKRGKWRPSRIAQRLGTDAVELETLRCRDGYTLPEAIELMRRNHRTTQSRQQLMDLAGQLPRRARRRMLGQEHLEQLATPGGNRQRIEELERASILTKVGRALTRALRGLAVEDLELLRYQYRDGLSLTEIAGVLDLRRRKVYTRRARCLRRLRRLVEEEGLTGREVMTILGRGEVQIELDFERREASVA